MAEIRDVVRRPSFWTALLAGLLHLAVLPFFAATGLLAPAWAVMVLLVAWALLAAGLFVLVRRGSPLALLVPPAAMAVWFGTLTAGEQLLGWTG